MRRAHSVATRSRAHPVVVEESDMLADRHLNQPIQKQVTAGEQFTSYECASWKNLLEDTKLRECALDVQLNHLHCILAIDGALTL